MNLGKVNMIKDVNSPYDLWKAKADLVEFYKAETDRVKELNKLLAFTLGFSLVTIISLAGYICKYL